VTKKNLTIVNHASHQHGVDTIAGSRLAVLCLDDDESILHAIKRQLRSQPYDVVITTSPYEALDMLRAPNNIGLIIADYYMPLMTGTEFLQQAKVINPEISRMILSGHADTKVTLDAINQGEAFRFMQKPWGDGELEAVINDGLQRYRLVKENNHLGNLTVKQLEEFNLWSSSLKQRVLQQSSLIRQKLSDEKQHLAQLKKTTAAALDMLTKIMASRDQNLYDHSLTVSELALSIAINLNLSKEQQEITRIAGLLHDLGKVCLPDRILLKTRGIAGLLHDLSKACQSDRCHFSRAFPHLRP
jgi:adenylate cyclase